MTERQYGAKHPTDPDEANPAGEHITPRVTPGPVPEDGQGLTWVVNVTGTDTFEMTGAEISDAYGAGRITEATLVWRQGMSEWAPLGTVPQLLVVLSHPEPAETEAVDAVEQSSPGWQFDETFLDEANVAAEQLPEDEVTELWASHDEVPGPEIVEQLPEDEVTELWGQQEQAVPGSQDPTLTFSYGELDVNDLPEDEVTELWGRQQAEEPAVVQSYAYGIGAPVQSERLPEDEVTAVYAEGMPGLVMRRDLEREQASAALAERLITQLQRDRPTVVSAARAAPKPLGTLSGYVRDRKAAVVSTTEPIVAFLAAGVGALRDVLGSGVRWVLGKPSGQRLRAPEGTTEGLSSATDHVRAWLRRVSVAIQGFADGRRPAPPARAVGLSLVPVALVAGERRVREGCVSGARWVARSRMRVIATSATAIVLFAVLVFAGLYARGSEGSPKYAASESADPNRSVEPPTARPGSAALGSALQPLDAVSVESLPLAGVPGKRDPQGPQTEAKAAEKLSDAKVALELERTQRATLEALKTRKTTKTTARRARKAKKVQAKRSTRQK